MTPPKLKVKAVRYRIVRIRKTEKLATKKFEAWWKAQKFDGPTFFACYVKGFEDGYNLKRKPKGGKA